MEERSRRILDFPAVLELLAEHAVSAPGKAACRALKPLPAQAPQGGLAEAWDLTRQGMAWLGASGYRPPDLLVLDGLLQHLATSDSPLDLDDLWALKTVLLAADEARGALPDSSAGHDAPYPALAALAAQPPAVNTLRGLSRCLGADGNLRDEASPELYSARTEIRSLHRQCVRRVKDFVAKQGHGLLGQYLQDDFMTISGDRYVLPLKTNFKGRVKGIIHDYSQTGETCYFEPFFLVEKNNQLQELKQEEREAEREVLVFLTNLARQERENVAADYRLLTELDLLAAKAGFAEAYGCRELEPEGEVLDLKTARHPLLYGREGGRPVAPVAVDISLKPGQRGLVISGGNAGGKTVCLKTLGLCALMAHAAIPAPVAAGSTLPRLARVHALVGDEQSLSEHVSTFSAQIVSLTRVLGEIGLGAEDDADTSGRASSPQRGAEDAVGVLRGCSLFLLDEFGAGTDPSQGAALAQAVLDTLLEAGAFAVAATHFPALKAYAFTRDDVRAASVLFDPATKKPLYSLGYDQVGASQALDVAREHGLPEAILERAERYLLLDGQDTAQLMERLNSLAVEKEREAAALVRERDKLREKRAKLDERFAKERDRLVEELRAESRTIMKGWQEGKKAHKAALRELAAVRDKAARTTLEEPETGQEAGQTARVLDLTALKPGDALRYVPWGKRAVVEEVDARKGELKIDLSGVSMRVKASDCEALEGACAQAKANDVLALKAGRGGSAGPGQTPGQTPGLTLDLRGRRADEAAEELAAFLDKALMGNFGQLEVVHGKGTGALRQEVHRVLRDSPVVAGFGLAPEDRGGDGMTLVELK